MEKQEHLHIERELPAKAALDKLLEGTDEFLSRNILSCFRWIFQFEGVDRWRVAGTEPWVDIYKTVRSDILFPPRYLASKIVGRVNHNDSGRARLYIRVHKEF